MLLLQQAYGISRLDVRLQACLKVKIVVLIVEMSAAS